MIQRITNATIIKKFITIFGKDEINVSNVKYAYMRLRFPGLPTGRQDEAEDYEEIPDLEVLKATRTIRKSADRWRKVAKELHSLLWSENQLLSFLSAPDRSTAERSIYKSTECGAWIEFCDDGVFLGSIVEGSDSEVRSLKIMYPFSESNFNITILGIEDEVDRIWRDHNTAPHPKDETL